MSRSLHVTKSQRQKDHHLNRDESGAMSGSMSKLDELALKKVAAKETEDFKRAASKIGGLRHTEFKFTDAGLILHNQKSRGCISDIPGEVIPPRD